MLGGVMIMPDDPTTIYTPSQSVGWIASITVLAADTGFPRLYMTAFPMASGILAAMFACQMSAIYGALTGAGSITLGVDVVLRET